MISYAIYKCRVCGKEEGAPNRTAIRGTDPYDFLKFAIQVPARFYQAHECADGSIGICELVGIRKAEEVKHEEVPKTDAAISPEIANIINEPEVLTPEE